MGSWASVEVSGHGVLHYRSFVDPDVLFLLTLAEVAEGVPPRADSGGEHEDESHGSDDDSFESPALRLSAPASMIKQRLDLLGMDAAGAERQWQEIHDDEVEWRTDDFLGGLNRVLDSPDVITGEVTGVSGVAEKAESLPTCGEPESVAYADVDRLIRRAIADLDRRDAAAAASFDALERSDDSTDPADSERPLAIDWERHELETLRDLRTRTFPAWISGVRTHLAKAVDFRDRFFEVTGEDWDGRDARWFLRAVLLAVDDDTRVTIDLSHLVGGGYLDVEGFDPQQAAIETHSTNVARGMPAVILLEGNNDVEFIRAALEIRRPHLASYVRFYDHASSNSDAGVGVATRTLRAFAAAGIANRVVAMLDNDAAAAEAIQALRRKGALPPNYTVLTYPPTALAADYPTVGATGTNQADVNGAAASIELYLGGDVLTGPDGALVPVRWGNYLSSVQRYQGEVEHKREIHQRFRGKVSRAREAPDLVDDDDWVELDLILDHLFAALASGVA